MPSELMKPSARRSKGKLPFGESARDCANMITESSCE